MMVPGENKASGALKESAGRGRLSSGFASLRLELLLISLALVLVMSATMGLTLTWIYESAVLESQIESAAAFARGAALAVAPVERPNEFYWGSLEQAATEAKLKFVLVSDGYGRIVKDSGQADSQDMATYRAALAYGFTQTSFNGHRYSVAAPIFRRHAVAGAICFSGLAGDLLTIRTEARFWMLSALGLNISLMGLVLVFFFNRRLLVPVKELARDLENLRLNQFEPRLRPRSSREMTELFQAFDRAALELMDSRRRLEEQLKTISETQNHLVASEKMATVGLLASGLAHELGNPIGALIGFVHLLRQDNLNPGDKTLILDHSAQELARMDGSLKELLHFSRPAKGGVTPVDAAEVASAAINLARPQKWAAGVDFFLEVEAGQSLVMAERNRLLQVLLNLLANAGQALAHETSGARVVILITRPDSEGKVRLKVMDNGPGVDPADVPHLFEPYFSRKEPGQGTGLGLAVSLSIIDGLGGRLEYSPAPSGGAVFIITLAVANQEVA